VADKAAPVPAQAADTAEQERAQSALRGETWAVALDAFSDAKNVKQLRTRLTAAGVKSYTEPVTTSKGELTRVRAGPFSSKEAADKARAKLEAMGLKPGAVASR
jgi:DedD protein